jgi:hypothetical protein
VSGLGTSLAPQNRSLAGAAIKRFNVSADVARDPEQLARVLQLVTNSIQDLGATANGNPFASSVLVRDVSATSGVILLVSHQLGRRVNGWLPARARGASWAGYELRAGDFGFDSSVDPTKQVQILAGATGLFDFLFY